MRIDLHSHSTASDGRLSPTQLVELARDRDVSTLALTDHDTLRGSAEAQAAGLKHGNEIPSNPKAQAGDADSKVVLAQFADYMKTAVVLDWDAVNESRPAWNARWNRLIER